MQVAIVGAGNVGSGLGSRFEAAGHDVVYGVRSVEGWTGPGRALPVSDAVRDAELVVLAVPWKAVPEALSAAGDLDGKILVDCTNPVGWSDGPTVGSTAHGSGAGTIAALTHARVVKAFNTFGAEFHRSARIDGQPVDVLIASDDDDAKARVGALARDAGFDPIDAGPLRNAALLEHLAVLWMHLATKGGRGRDFVFQLISDAGR